MTSPLSLLGMLGGADPAPEPAPPQDPAAFAAALLAALQVLQPPAVTQPAPLPTVTADVAEDGAGTPESGDADAEASSAPAGVTADDQGQVAPVGNAIVVELAGDADPGLPDCEATTDAATTSDGEPLADASEPGTTAVAPTTTEAKGTARTGRSGAGDSAPESTAAKLPAQLGEGAETATRPTSGATPVERSLETKPRHGARTAKRNAGPAFMPAEMERTVAMPERKLAARKCEPSPVEAAPRIGRDAPPVAAPAAIATAAPRPVGPEVEARLPGPAVEADAEDEKPAVGGAPRQLDAGAPAGTTVPVVPVLPPPVVAPRTAVPARAADERPSRESTPAPVPPQVDAAGNPEPWTQAGNARLASQLAELMQGLDVTEFRMTLARRNGPPAAPREGAMADLTDAVPAGETAKPVGVMALSAPEAAVTAALGPETLADADTGAAPPAMKPAPATARPVQAGSAEAAPSLVEKPASQAMLPSYRAEAPSNVVSTPAGGAEPMAPVRPARATARSPEPTLPVVRQELPESAGATESRVAPAPSRPRERREPSSDSPASVSGLGSTPAERIASRGDADTVGAKREARNLPQPDGGSERPAGSADRVTLQVSDGEGRQTRIRVSVVGDQVRAVITPPDNESARQLEHRMDELQTALARQGFTASRVSVQAAGESGSEGAVAAAVPASTSDVRTTPGREQPAGDQRQGRGQRDQQPPGGGHRQQQGRSRDQGTEQRRRQP